MKGRGNNTGGIMLLLLIIIALPIAIIVWICKAIASASNNSKTITLDTQKPKPTYKKPSGQKSYILGETDDPELTDLDMMIMDDLDDEF